MHELEISRHRRRDRHPRRDRRAGADTNVAAADSKNATGKLHHDTTWQSRFCLGDGGISKPRRQPQRQNREAGAGRNDATRRLDHRQRQRAKRNDARRHVAVNLSPRRNSKAGARAGHFYVAASLAAHVDATCNRFCRQDKTVDGGFFVRALRAGRCGKPAESFASRSLASCANRSPRSLAMFFLTAASLASYSARAFVPSTAATR